MDTFINNLPPLCKDTIQPLWMNLDNDIKSNHYFTHYVVKLEGATKVNGKILLSGLILFIAVYLVFGYGAHFLCNILGFVYPAYASFKAIENTNKNVDVGKQWLTYWLVFATFGLSESLTGIVINWIPFYYLIKCIFLLYLYHPSTLGAKTLYTKFIRSHLLRYQNSVDRTISKANKLAEKIVSEAKTSVTEK